MRVVDTRSVSRLLRALGDETRLRIVALLAHGELCVCHIGEALGLPQPTVSRHLSVLRVAGVVETRRDGAWIHYRIALQTDPDRKRQLDFLVQSFTQQKGLAKTVARLVKARGPETCK